MSEPGASTRTPARTSGWVRIVPIFAALAVGAASFTLSFFAQSEVAAALGAVPQRLSWLVPIIIDGGVLAGSASVWSSSTRESKKDPVAYLTIVTLLALSVVINVHHATGRGGVLAQIIAGAPPVVLLLCLEIVAAQARRDARGVLPASTQLASTPAAATPGALASPQAPAGTWQHASVSEPASTTTAGPVVARHAADVASPAYQAPALPAQAVAAHLAQLAAPLSAASHSPLPAAPAPASSVPATSASRTTPQTTGTEHPRPTLSVVHAAAPRPTPKATAAVKSPSQADQVRARYQTHVQGGGDPFDKTLARKIADELNAPLPSVRRVLAEVRPTALEA